MMRKSEKTRSREDILSIAARLIAERGWRGTSDADIMAEADIGTADYYGAVSGKYGIPAGLSQRMTRDMLRAGEDWEPEDSVRDKLFDMFMARFDAEPAIKRCFERMVRAAPTDPLLAAALTAAAMVAMRNMLEAAGVQARGLLGILRVQAMVGAVYAPTLRDWFSDDTPDLGKTMAALNARLERIDILARRFESIVPGGKSASKPHIVSAIPPLNELIEEPLQDRPSRKVAGKDSDVGAARGAAEGGSGSVARKRRATGKAARPYSGSRNKASTRKAGKSGKPGG